MYFEKGNEQQRKADALKQKLKNNPNMPESQKRKIKNQIASCENESLAQIKKGLKTFEEVQVGLKNQGYSNLPEPNENFKKIANELKNYHSTVDDDLDGLKNKLQEYGFKDIDDFNNKLSTNIESLKFSKKPPERFKIKPPKLADVGGVAGMINDAMSIKDKIDKAQQGSNWLVNFEDDDSMLETGGKALLIAGAELEPFGIMDSAERGFNVDEKIKEYIQNSIERGEVMSDGEIAALMIGGAVTETGKKLVLEPAEMVKDFGVETYEYFIGGPINDYQNKLQNEASAELIEQKKQAATKRQYNFNLSSISPSKSGQLKAGDNISFNVDRNTNWNSSYSAKWKLYTPMQQIEVKNIITSDGGANSINLTVPENFGNGSYRVELTITELTSGLLVDKTSSSFKIKNDNIIGNISAIDRKTKASISKVIDKETKLDFSTGKNSNWVQDFSIEWFVDGDLIKSRQANAPDANIVSWSVMKSDEGFHKVSVRAVSDNKIVDHAQINYTVKFKQKETENDKEENKENTENKEKTTEQEDNKEKVKVNVEKFGWADEEEQTSEESSYNPEDKIWTPPSHEIDNLYSGITAAKIASENNLQSGSQQGGQMLSASNARMQEIQNSTNEQMDQLRQQQQDMVKQYNENKKQLEEQRLAQAQAEQKAKNITIPSKNTATAQQGVQQKPNNQGNTRKTASPKTTNKVKIDTSAYDTKIKALEASITQNKQKLDSLKKQNESLSSSYSQQRAAIENKYKPKWEAKYKELMEPVYKSKNRVGGMAESFNSMRAYKSIGIDVTQNKAGCSFRLSLVPEAQTLDTNYKNKRKELSQNIQDLTTKIQDLEKQKRDLERQKQNFINQASMKQG